MKLKNLSWTFAAAITLIAAAYANEKPMMAKIPFAFQVAGSNLPAGEYLVGPGPGEAIVQLSNMTTGKTVFLLSRNSLIDSRQRARLVFKCADGERCSLATVWSASGVGLEFPVSAVAQKERRETIDLER